MLYRFFIERPVFANVTAIVIVIMGAVAFWFLPTEQYPQITPPTVRITTNYPGASAEVVADTVAAPLEEQINGVERMLYMNSVSSSDGSYSLEITFEVGTDLDVAQTLVQNRVAMAEPLLPEDVRRQGVITRKQSPSLLLVFSLASTDEAYDSLFLANYSTLRIKDELARIYGVGEVTVFGTANYSMRIWMNSDEMKVRRLSADDVVTAIRQQNLQVAAGQIGQPPVTGEQNFQYTVTARGRLSDVSEFEDIVVKSQPGGRNVYLKDVARIELGSQSYSQFTEKQGQPNANIGIFQLPGSNALEVAHEAKSLMQELQKKFPKGVTYTIPIDTTLFVEESISEVYRSLLEAGVLVLLVIVIFLQDWRAVFIPATVVPVTIIGTFFVMQLLGFTVNMLTMFGLVLAIGIVVDDAIVVVENAARHVEKGLGSKPAAIAAMTEVVGPIIGMTLVLMAVFLPAAFLGGVTGPFYRQFALTIATTAVLSGFIALTLNPVQCAQYLRQPREKKNIFFRGFNAVYAVAERGYTWLVRIAVHHLWPTTIVFAALITTAGVWYVRMPKAFLPSDDQGYVLMSIQLPDAASLERTHQVMDHVNDILAETPGVVDWINIGGMSLIDRSSAPNAGTIFASFAPWSDRTTPETSLQGILDHLRAEFAKIQEATIVAFPPPAIRGLGRRGGFQLQIEDREGIGLVALDQVVDEVLREAESQSALTAVNTTFRPGVPQLRAEVDRVKAASHDVPIDRVFGGLQAALGSVYVNDLNKFGRTYQVRVQSEYKFRDEPRDIRQLAVRNRQGQLVPLGAVVEIDRSYGPQVVNRYNLYASASISGEPAAGYSSGEALDVMSDVARNILPPATGYEWTGMAYQELQVGNEGAFIFIMAVTLVYLVLAAQYESWFLPAAVVLVVPIGLLGAVAAVSGRGMANDIYTQVGIVLVIALASKNAILIVEFARDLHKEGRSAVDAAIEAAQLRFRPILMTSFTFMLGVVPLVIAHGAGSEGRRALGTAVLGGMTTSVLLAIFFVPAFYVVFQRIHDWRERHRVLTKPV